MKSLILFVSVFAFSMANAAEIHGIGKAFFNTGKSAPFTYDSAKLYGHDSAEYNAKYSCLNGAHRVSQFTEKYETKTGADGDYVIATVSAEFVCN